MENGVGEAVRVEPADVLRAENADEEKRQRLLPHGATTHLHALQKHRLLLVLHVAEHRVVREALEEEQQHGEHQVHHLLVLLLDEHEQQVYASRSRRCSTHENPLAVRGVQFGDELGRSR